MARIPDRGDIVHLQSDPASGREMKGPHFALVLSPKVFNQLGLAMMCPLSQGAAQMERDRGMLVTLMGTGTKTQGAVHSHQLKSLDWKQRKARIVERVDEAVIDEVLARVNAILFD